MNHRFYSPRGRQTGASLIEVLVAVLILGVGLLGVAAMQAASLRNSQSAYESTQAVAQSYAILDILRANRVEAVAGSFNTGSMRCVAADIDSDHSVGRQAAQADVNAWVAGLKRNIGSAGDTSTCGSITCAANTFGGADCTIAVQWDDSRGTAVDTGAGHVERTIETVVAI